ncbi:Hyalin [Holothuria leucospilota]|uniref:Hyalin n=1 Tax=Holothuria leucospilota TaxID=206669 RepID=A0A9Q1CAR6_HOLLE|nr:Hyalin [Holothuria leucospilota]
MILQLSAFLLIFFYLDTAQAGTPSIDNCPGTIFRRVSSSDATVSVTWDEPNCGTNSHSTHSEGSEFSPGVHHVVYWFASSTDRSNTNERCCSFDVVVSGPAFDLCSQNLCKGGEVCVPEVDRYYCYPGGTNIKIRNCSETVIIRKRDGETVIAQWVEPTAFDHYGHLLQPSGMPQFSPGSSLGLGEHAITYTFTDRGHMASCSFRVIAAENTGPGFQNCPQDITVMSSESAVRVYWLEPMLQTNEDRNQVSFTQTHNPGQLFSVPSETTVTYTFKDTGTSKPNECSFVVSTVAPESMNGVVLPPTTAKFVRILQRNPGQSPEAWPRPYYHRFSNTHTSPLIVIPSRIQDDIRSGSTNNHVYPKGFYPVTYNFTDVDGNLLETSEFVIVYYNNDPAPAPILLGCAGNSRIEVPSEVPSTASWSEPYVEGNEVNLVWTEKPQLRPNQDILPLGETVLDYMFYSPNVEGPLQCLYTVSITDNIPPQFLFCPSAISKTVRSENGLSVDFPGYLIAHDGSDGVFSSVFSSQPPPVFVQAGQSQVITYTAADMYGNTATCVFTVSVSLEDLPAVITKCSNRTLVTSEGMTAQLNTIDYPSASRGSEIPDIPAILSQSSFMVNTETTVEATFPSLEGDSFIGDRTCTFNVLVLDDTPPVVNNCTQEVTLAATKGEDFVRVNWTEPASVDSLEGGSLVNRTHAPLDPFPVGETTVVWYIFEDEAGFQRSCSINITIEKVPFEPCRTQPIAPGDQSEIFAFTSDTIVVIVVTAVATFVFSLAIFLMSLCCCTCCCVVDTAKTNTSSGSSSDDVHRTRLFVKIGGKNIPIYGPVTPLSSNEDVGAGRQIDDGEFDYEVGQPTSSRAYQNEAPSLPSFSESLFSNTTSNVATENDYIGENGGRENYPYGYDSATGDSRVPPPRPPKPGQQENASKMMRKRTFLEMQAAVQSIREEQAWKGRVVDDGLVYGFDQPAS